MSLTRFHLEFFKTTSYKKANIKDKLKNFFVFQFLSPIFVKNFYHSSFQNLEKLI